MTTPPQVRLIPLIENSGNERVANCLARMLSDSPEHDEMSARGALFILTGIQEFLDSGGDYLRVESLWEPHIVARQLDQLYGAESWKKAAEMAGESLAKNDKRAAEIYATAAEMLHPEEVKIAVDKPEQAP